MELCYWNLKHSTCRVLFLFLALNLPNMHYPLCRNVVEDRRTLWGRRRFLPVICIYIHISNVSKVIKFICPVGNFDTPQKYYWSSDVIWEWRVTNRILKIIFNSTYNLWFTQKKKKKRFIKLDVPSSMYYTGTSIL